MAKRLILAVFMAALLIPLAGSAPVYVGGGGSKTSPGIVLTDTIFVAVDRELNIWNGQLSPIPFPDFPYLFTTVCSEGQAENRSYRWTPSAATDATATIKAYDYGLNQVQQSSVQLSAISKTSGAGTKKLLFIGDSLIDAAGDPIPTEVDTLFVIDSGGGDVVCIGTQSAGGVVFHEGRGGWTWERFTTDFGPGLNPFWDTGRINFQSYSIGDLGGMEPDFIVINLGGNEANNAAIAGNILDTAAVINTATAFLDTLLSTTYGFHQSRIIINLMPTATGLPSGFGDDYGAAYDPALYLKNIRSLFRAYVTAFDAGAYHSQVDVCYSGLWVDPDYGYPSGSVAVSARNSNTEPTGTNFLHPATTGNYQISDGIYSHLRQLQRYDDSGCTNELADSWQFTDAAEWGTISTVFTVTGGQEDFSGGVRGTSYVAIATSTGVYSQSLTNEVAATDDMVVSIFAKDISMSDSEQTATRVYNVTDGNIVEEQITFLWTAGVPAYSAGGTTGGAVDLGNGWYQMWGHVDTTANNGDTMYVKFAPNVSSPTIGEGIIVAAIQWEFDVTTPCGTYLQTP